MEREVNAIKHSFPESSGISQLLPAACAGNAATIWSGAFGASALGEPGKTAENVAREVREAFLRELGSKASMDSHLADQMLIYAALAQGRTEFSAASFSSHLRTNAEVLRAMTGRNIILAGERDVEVV